jgi:hypothetical protein
MSFMGKSNNFKILGHGESVVRLTAMEPFGKQHDLRFEVMKF